MPPVLMRNYNDHSPDASSRARPMSHAQFKLIYDGPALDDHTMDVRDLAPALLAIGELLEAANGTLNQDRASVSVGVKGSFKTGCFGVDFICNQSLIQHIQDLFVSSPVSAALNLLTALGFVAAGGKGLVELLVWLRGRKPSRVKLCDNGTCEVYVDQEHLVIEQRVLDLYRNLKLRQAFEAALKPLDRDGIESVAVVHGEAEAVTITKAQAAFFAAPTMEEELLDESESVLTVQAVSVSFREDNKWRFTDGGAPFHASIDDRDFLRRVQDNEVAFSRGDLLKVRMRKRQYLAGERMHTECQIIEVLEHRRAAVQIPLPFRPDDHP